MSSDPVLAFERKFSGMIGADYAIAVNSGTSALHAALEAIDDVFVRNPDLHKINWHRNQEWKARQYNEQHGG